MISITRQERQWFLRNIARGFVQWMGAIEPPVELEEMLKHPPQLYDQDFGVVDMYSNLWDATFARPPNKRGSIFVRVDLEPKQRRYALARETLSALITSEHGRAMGLQEMLMDNLQESAEYFASHILAPGIIVDAHKKRSNGRANFSDVFMIPEEIAQRRWQETSE
jgi:hypothetical protein